MVHKFVRSGAVRNPSVYHSWLARLDSSGVLRSQGRVKDMRSLIAFLLSKGYDRVHRFMSAGVRHYYDDNAPTYIKIALDYITVAGGEITRRVDQFPALKTPRAIRPGILPLNSVCTYMGVCAFTPSRALPRFLPSNTRLLDFADDLIQRLEKGYISSVNIDVASVKRYRDIIEGHILKDRVVISSTPASQWPLLVESARMDYDLDVHYISNVVDRIPKRWLGIPTIHDIEYELSDIRVNLDASPGFLSKYVYGSTRRESLLYTVPTAETILQHLRVSKFHYPCMWEVLGRSKSIKIDNLLRGDYGKTRVVLNMEEPYMLVMQHFIQRLMDSIVDNPVSTITIGKDFKTVINPTFVKLVPEFDYVVELDWPNFDTHVHHTELKVAISLLRNYFTASDPARTKFIDNAFCLFSDILINKRIVLENCQVYRLKNYLASGVPGTSLIGSLINLIRISMISYRIYGKDFSDKIYPFVNGDDTIILMKGSPKLSKGSIQEIIRSDLKLDIDDIFVYSTKDIMDYKATPTYLKRYLSYDNAPTWAHDKVLQKLVYPEAKMRGFADIYNRVLGYVCEFKYDITFNTFLYYYLQYCIVHFYPHHDLDILWAMIDSIDSKWSFEQTLMSTNKSGPVSLSKYAMSLSEFSINYRQNPGPLRHLLDAKLIAISGLTHIGYLKNHY